MTTSTTQNGIRPTSNRLCDEPATFVRDDCVSWMNFDPRYHRSDPSNFPRVEFIPHPADSRLLIEVCVEWLADEGTEFGRLEATACGLRLRHSYRTTRLCGLSVVTSLAVELAAEKQALLNQ